MIDICIILGFGGLILTYFINSYNRNVKKLMNEIFSLNQVTTNSTSMYNSHNRV